MICIKNIAASLPLLFIGLGSFAQNGEVKKEKIEHIELRRGQY